MMKEVEEDLHQWTAELWSWVGSFDTVNHVVSP